MLESTGIIPDMAELVKAGSIQHFVVHQAEPSLVQHVQKLKLQSGSLEGHQDVHMGIANKFCHCILIRVADEADIFFPFHHFPDPVGRVHACDDQGDIEVVENLVDQVCGGMGVFRHFDIAVIEGVFTFAVHNIQGIIRMKTGDIMHPVAGEVLLQVMSIFFTHAKHQAGMLQYALVQPQFATGTKEINPVEQVLAHLEQVKIIAVLNIAFAIYLNPVFQAGFGEVVAGMKAFEKNGMIVLQEAFQHLFRPPAGYNIWFGAKSRYQAGLAGIIVNFFTVFVQFICAVAARVLNAVQVYFYAFLVKCFELIKHVDHAPVVGRVWYIERDYMQMLIRQGLNKFGLVSPLHFPSKAP